MTDYTGKVRSYLESVDKELHQILSSVVEEDLFIDTLREELNRLDEAEAQRVDHAGDEILAVLQRSEDKKLTDAKADLQSAAHELARRWDAAQKEKKLLKTQHEAKNAQCLALRRELAQLKAARQGGSDAFGEDLEAKLQEAVAGAGEKEVADRRSAALNVANSILAYKKSQKSQAPMSELLPIDRSVSRIYQKMSYLMQGQ